MENRGTGWLPDYPDVRDRKIDKLRIINIQKVQNEKTTELVESLANKIFDALIQLEENPKIAQLRSDLLEEIEKEKEALGNLAFVPAKFCQNLKLGMSGKEVLHLNLSLDAIFGFFIKNSKLNSNQQNFEQLINRKGGNVTNLLEFNSETEKKVKDFQETQKFILRQDGVVDSDTMKAIIQLVNFIKEDDKDRDSMIHIWWNFAIWNRDKAKEFIGGDEALAKVLIECWIYFANGLLEILNSNDKVIENSRKKGLDKDDDSMNEEQEVISYKSLLIEISEIMKTITPEVSTQKILENVIKNIKDEKYEEALKETKNIKEGLKQEHKKFIQKTFKEGIPKIPLIKEEIHVSPPIPNEIVDIITKKLIIGLLMEEEDEQTDYNVKSSRLLEEIKEDLKDEDSETLARLKDAKDISNPEIFKLFKKYYIEEYIGDSENFNQLINSIVKATIQIIYPLGKYSNLEEAVEVGLNKFDSFFKKKQESPENKLKKIVDEILREAKEKHLPEKSDFPEKVDRKYETFNNLYLKNLVEEVVDQVSKVVDRISEEEKVEATEDEQGKIIKRLLRNLKHRYDIPLSKKDSQSERKELLAKRKELLDVTEYINCNANNECGNKSEEELIFPANFNLNKRLKEKKEELKNYTSSSVYLTLPDFVDLSFWCSSIKNQGSLNSCTAHAGIALKEYFEKKRFGKYIEASPLFLYKVVRHLMKREEDKGASVRETMKAMVLFGVPPEEYWPYEENKVNEEPNAFCYSFAQQYQALQYFRLDHVGISNAVLLAQIKTVLASGFPCMFGFTLYSSAYDSSNAQKGYIPYPGKKDEVKGGHAVVAVGYDNYKVIENADQRKSEGALLVRNSWGTQWGEGGYGWLPYDYVWNGLTADWWSLFQSEWFETGQFGLGSNDGTSERGAPGNGHNQPR